MSTNSVWSHYPREVYNQRARERTGQKPPRPVLGAAAEWWIKINKVRCPLGLTTEKSSLVGVGNRMEQTKEWWEIKTTEQKE